MDELDCDKTHEQKLSEYHYLRGYKQGYIDGAKEYIKMLIEISEKQMGKLITFEKGGTNDRK